MGRTTKHCCSDCSKTFTQKRQFFSAVSHELQTQLIIVQGYVPQTIGHGDNLTERQVKGLSTAEEESIRMQRIFKELRLVLVLAQGSILLLFLLEAQPIVDDGSADRSLNCNNNSITFFPTIFTELRMALLANTEKQRSTMGYLI